MIDWQRLIEQESRKDYFKTLTNYVARERANGKTIYPPADQVFSALDLTPIEQCKVVILGQDPYHGPGQANGLAFSVNQGQAIPPSLRNIFKEVSDDIGCNIPLFGDLADWAKQGVLLLNAVLTVEQALPNSHKDKGWEVFTDKIIELLNSAEHHIVFLLWGSYSQKKANLISNSQHTVLKAPHPSPLSAHRGFFGCKHFSLANKALTKHNQSVIDWQLT
ncbi:MAG: uracil-DNA glycosylase [Kangiellaceae bacterium]|jgi:uracil-DNA glycosylase|nr:uracil-DNA glycosylase [Kangiellaceae bacterium]